MPSPDVARGVVGCQVAELSGRVSALRMSLQLSAMREFELLGTGEDKPNPLLLERLRACCLVIDVLGFKVCAHRPSGRSA